MEWQSKRSPREHCQREGVPAFAGITGENCMKYPPAILKVTVSMSNFAG
jgi:hypothetical protein